MMKNRFQNFGQVFRELRQMRDISQNELGQKVGVHGQFISNAERGKCALPVPMIKQFSKLLNLSMAEKTRLLLALIADETAQARTKWEKAFR